MRYFWALFAYVTAVVVAVASCGGSKGTGDSSFTTTSGSGASASTATANGGGTGSGLGGGLGNGGSTGVFSGGVGGSTGDGGTCQAYKSCAEQNLNCGTTSDGCGNIINCGTCPTGQTCGAGGTQGVCATPPCIPTTCSALGYNCGNAGDGCNTTCAKNSDCPSGEICDTTQTPAVCVLSCGTCDGGTCGSNSPNQCGAGICNAKTCSELGQQCGSWGDGCGNTLNCGTCSGGQTCSITNNVATCVTACTPKTCSSANANCGQIPDGCNTACTTASDCPTGEQCVGGFCTLSCGTCSAGSTCGGGGANKCGSATTCTGGLCTQQTTCPGTATTSITGVVYAPNGVDPLPNTLVYVPNLGTAGLQPFADGVAVQHCACSADISGDPLVSATTDYTGTFTITDMPVGASIPLVLQNGRWRRVVTIANVPSCVTTTITNASLSNGTMQMPSTQKETSQWDNIPLMGFVTGSVDGLECALRKIGIADSQFTNPGGGGRVLMYLGSGSAGAQINGATPSETSLWGTQAEIDAYDMVYFACQGDQYDKTTAAQTVVLNYANAGGRVFNTHYSYVWLYDNGPWSGTAAWAVNSPTTFLDDPGTGVINTSFAAGSQLSQWLYYIKASTTMGQMSINTLRNDFTGVNAPSQLWVTEEGDPIAGNQPMHYTFDTPWNAASNALCGKVLYDDFHVEDIENNPSTGVTFPNECCAADNVGFCLQNSDCCSNKCNLNTNVCSTNKTCTEDLKACTTNAQCCSGVCTGGKCLGVMTPQEKMLEYFIFNLGGCVQPPVCIPTTCTAQGATCGEIADGCGNILSCGGCPSGQTCTNGQCVAGCMPQTCQQQMFACGMQGDGCGNAINCGGCPSGQTCIAGTCQTGVCMSKTCTEQNVMCGTIGDGCGNAINCGTCPAGEVCGGKTPGQCYKPPCTPTTCSALGFNCGNAPDGCNSACTSASNCPSGEACVGGVCVLSCGTCSGGQVCGGGSPPKANVCGGGAN